MPRYSYFSETSRLETEFRHATLKTIRAASCTTHSACSIIQGVLAVALDMNKSAIVGSVTDPAL